MQTRHSHVVETVLLGVVFFCHVCFIKRSPNNFRFICIIVGYINAINNPWAKYRRCYSLYGIYLSVLVFLNAGVVTSGSMT